MKIERKEPEFQPITITIETQDELEQMFALATYCSFISSSGLDTTETIYNNLKQYDVNRRYSSNSEFCLSDMKIS